LWQAAIAATIIACLLHSLDRICHRTNPNKPLFLRSLFLFRSSAMASHLLNHSAKVNHILPLYLPFSFFAYQCKRTLTFFCFVFCLFNAFCWFQVRNASKLLRHERALLARWFSGDAQSSLNRNRGNCLVSCLSLNCN